MELSLLEKSILATIAYYDVLEYPLTGFEAFKYLINPSHIIAQSKSKKDLTLEPLALPSFFEVFKTLDASSLSRFVEEKNGFYCLRKSHSKKVNSEAYIDKLIKTRIERQKISDKKWKKAREIIKWLELIPYTRAVLISGSLALDNTKKHSDIDLLIVVKHKRIWTARFLITGFIHIIGKRRYKEKTSDRICLNHYITDESLKIDFPSLYNAQTYAHLILVLENEKDINKKFKKANEWIKDYVVFWGEEDVDQRLIKSRKVFKGIAKFQEIILDTFLGSALEKILGLIQKTIIKKHLPLPEDEGRVITDDFQLEFHPASPEVKILEKYNKNMLRLGFRTNLEKDSGLLIIKQE